MKLNYIGNAVWNGPSSENGSFFWSEGSQFDRGHFANNKFDGVIPADPYFRVTFDNFPFNDYLAYLRTPRFPVDPVVTDQPQAALERVLEFGGAILPRRDSVDANAVADFHNRTGQHIDSQTEAGGWPVLNSEPPLADTDKDGMPNDWELARQLDPNDAADRNLDRNSDGYTNLEDYLNWLVRPTIRIQSPDFAMGEGETRSVILERTGYTDSILRVDLDLGGDAGLGTDIHPFFPAVVFPVGGRTVPLNLSAFLDDQIEPDEIISVAVRPHLDQYQLGENTEVDVKVEDRTGSFSPVSGWTVR